MGEFLPQSVVDDALVSAEVQDGITVASLGCQTVREWQASMIRERLEALAAGSGGRLALSMAGVTSLGSSFIRDLLCLTDRCGAMGGRFVLYGMTPELRSLFRAAAFDQRIIVVNHREEAASIMRSGQRRPGFFGRLMGKKAA